MTVDEFLEFGGLLGGEFLFCEEICEEQAGGAVKEAVDKAAALGQAELLPGDEGGDDGVGAFEDAAAAELFDDGEDGRFFPAELFARQTAPGWDVWGNEVEPTAGLRDILSQRKGG